MDELLNFTNSILPQDESPRKPQNMNGSMTASTQEMAGSRSNKYGAAGMGMASSSSSSRFGGPDGGMLYPQLANSQTARGLQRNQQQLNQQQQLELQRQASRQAVQRFAERIPQSIKLYCPENQLNCREFILPMEDVLQ